jgi:hypothetical protein
MLGNLSIGVLQRSPKGLTFTCGECKSMSDVAQVHIPAALSLKESAVLHTCPRCAKRSSSSEIVEVIAR